MEKSPIENINRVEREKINLFFTKMDEFKKVLEDYETRKTFEGSYEKVMQGIELNKIKFKDDFNMDVDLEYVHPYFDKDVQEDGIGNHYFTGIVHIKTDKGIVRNGRMDNAGFELEINPGLEDSNKIVITGAPESYPSGFDFSKNIEDYPKKEILVKGKDAQLVGKMIKKMILMTHYFIQKIDKEDGFSNEKKYRESYIKAMEHNL